MLHAFQKKTKKGIATPTAELDLVGPKALIRITREPVALRARMRSRCPACAEMFAPGGGSPPARGDFSPMGRLMEVGGHPGAGASGQEDAGVLKNPLDVGF